MSACRQWMASGLGRRCSRPGWAPAACALCALLAGCASDVRLGESSSLCVELPAEVAPAAAADPETVTAALDDALSEAGFWRSGDSPDEDAGRIVRWYSSTRRDGADGVGFEAVAFHFAGSAGAAVECDVRVDLWRSPRIRAAAAWRSFHLLRDDILPRAMARASVRALVHPGSRTVAWEIRDLAARFAPGEGLPQDVRERVEAYEARWAFVRRLERAAAAARSTWTKWAAEPPWERPGDPLFGPSMYFAGPGSWTAFVAFALAATAGAGIWSKRGRWRTAGFLALAVLLLTPVKVPTWAGWVYLPHGYVHAVDFDPFYYFREPAFFLGAALGTIAAGWLMLGLLRRLARVWRDWRSSATGAGSR